MDYEERIDGVPRYLIAFPVVPAVDSHASVKLHTILLSLPATLWEQHLGYLRINTVHLKPLQADLDVQRPAPPSIASKILHLR